MLTWNGGPVCWQSKRQKQVAGSTWEAEYIAAHHAARKIKILRTLLQNMGKPQKAETPLYIDNAGIIATAKSPHPTAKSQQLDVQYHYLQEQIADGHIQSIKIPSADNPADCLTKPLLPVKFQNRLSALSLNSAQSSPAATAI